MKKTRLTPRITAAVAASVLASMVLASCGGGSDNTDSGPDAAGAEAPLFDALPQKFQDSGAIRVGSDIAYAPMEYYDTDGTTVVGFDKDLTDLLTEQLGVEFEWNNAVFDSLITQLKSDRIDVAISGMSDTAERQQEIDFVDYYRAGAMLLVAKGNPEGLTSIADLCGMTVAVQRGTTQAGYAKDQSKQCEADGQDPIDLLEFDRETEAMLQVKNGRAVSGLQDYPVATYNARTSGGGNDFEVVGDQIDAGPLGIGVSKENAELRDALQQAMQALIDSGDYQDLIEEYDTPLGAIDEATVNGGS
ncbi:ABC transporter substrate-binding protein [Nocardioides sp.]|uniref:ABC transporter substrate-binding protein n=1 Tax=Nocardioides sp. TaxID=35761 RepID=UPI0026232DC1|nr:ABC transporter substrate-binding protein [Nocardioides sp.]MDI6911091.1 ABC transporter substrate-binding protein [Nocardioides sp.]